MAIYNQFMNQIIATTLTDAHGEKRSKQFYEELLKSFPQKLPLHQHHDMLLETIGYAENFRLVPDNEHPNEWNFIGDIYITTDDLDEALQGISFSSAEPFAGNMDNPSYAVYLPYPLYNNEEFINELVQENSELLVGKWLQKALDPTSVGLIISGVALVLAPEWDIQYKKHIRPILGKILKLLPKLLDKNIAVDLIQCVKGSMNEEIQIYFISDRSRIVESYHDECIFSAFANIQRYLDNNMKAESVGIRRIKMYYDTTEKKYKMFHIEYLDGSDEHFV